MLLAPPQRRVELSPMQIARLTLVFLIASFVLLRTLPDGLRIVYPNTVFGYVTNAGGEIVRIAAGGAAERGGLIVGDRIDISAVPLEDRKPGLTGQNFSVYNPVRHLTAIRSGRRIAVELQGVPESPQSRIILALQLIVETVSITIGGLLAIVRPSRATFGFFLYCVGQEYPATMVQTVLPYPWRALVDGVAAALVAGGQAGLLYFAINFNDRLARWRRVCDVLAGSAWIASAVLYIDSRIGSIYAGSAGALQFKIYTSIQFAIVVGTVGVLAAAFLRTRGAERLRAGWIIGAFLVTLLGDGVAARLYPGILSNWGYALLQLLPVLPAVAVAYGVTRFHMLGVDFLMNRAIVYAATTVAIVGLFTTIEEAIGYGLYNSNVQLAYVIFAGFTMLIGVFFTRVRDVIRAIVDRVMFRDRLTARTQLEKLAREMQTMDTRESIENSLTTIVRSILDLRAAALFERRADRFVLLAHSGWPPDVETLPGDDPALTAIERDAESRFLKDQDWRRWSPSLAEVIPRWAMPISFDGEYCLLAVYGPEISGVDLDVDEVRALERLATAAALGLSNLRTREISEHLSELFALRDENQRLRSALLAHGQTPPL